MFKNKQSYNGASLCLKDVQLISHFVIEFVLLVKVTIKCCILPLEFHLNKMILFAGKTN